MLVLYLNRGEGGDAMPPIGRGDIMPISEARKRANAKYNAKAYDRLEMKVPKGKKELIHDYAAARGESLNGFMNRAIDETMERDGREGNG
jgi:predicted HicB family RNase H-like nuclease